jgi:hypothetical protein
MTRNAMLGRKFDSCHQFAVLLTRHMKPSDAKALCRENGWDGVARALDEQRHMVTRVARPSRPARSH